MTSRNVRARVPGGPLLALLALLLTGLVAPSTAHAHPAHPAHTDQTVPLVFGHRGAPGYRPEHTLAGYQLAIDMGADYIEPDLVSTKDGVLVARHENDITATTDVASHPEFADRRTTKVIDGKSITGWFTEDFTLAELKTLRAKERIPNVRPGNTVYDGMFEVPTFDEVIDLVQRNERRLHRTIGIAPETKHPSYFDSIGLSPEEPLVRTLRRHGLDRPNAPVVIQSFEISNLQQLDRMTPVPLVQLVDGSGAPYDQVLAGTGVTYADMVTPAGIAAISKYADWFSPTKTWVIPVDAAGNAQPPTDVVDVAHANGMKVVIWTLRAENQFMANDFRIGTDPNAHGDLEAEIQAFLDTGVDAFFTDFADLGVKARNDWVAGVRA